jgi:hypothetical protein
MNEGILYSLKICLDLVNIFETIFGSKLSPIMFMILWIALIVLWINYAFVLPKLFDTISRVYLYKLIFSFLSW